MANVFIKILLKYSKRIYKEKTFAMLGKPSGFLSKNLSKYMLRLHAPLVIFVSPLKISPFWVVALTKKQESYSPHNFC